MTKKIICIVVLSLFSLHSKADYMIHLVTQSDKYEVAVGEQFRVNIIQDPAGREMEIVFPKFRHFKVLFGPSVSSQTMELGGFPVNVKVFTFMLQAEKVGTFQIEKAVGTTMVSDETNDGEMYEITIEAEERTISVVESENLTASTPSVSSENHSDKTNNDDDMPWWRVILLIIGTGLSIAAIVGIYYLFKIALHYIVQTIIFGIGGGIVGLLIIWLLSSFDVEITETVWIVVLSITVTPCAIFGLVAAIRTTGYAVKAPLFTDIVKDVAKELNKKTDKDEAVLNDGTRVKVEKDIINEMAGWFGAKERTNYEGSDGKRYKRDGDTFTEK